MNPNKMPAKVFRLVKEDDCKTSGDIAAELDISVARASEYVVDLIKAGRLRRTGQKIPNWYNNGQQFLEIEAAE